MIWTGFPANDMGLIHEITTTMGRFMLKNILETRMFPFATREMPPRWIFQRDNDPKHISKYAK